MSYSIQYGKTIKQKRRKKGSHFWPLAALIIAILLRIGAGSALDALRDLVLGEGQAIAAFYEDFVKD